jgi:hypothetical protein
MASPKTSEPDLNLAVIAAEPLFYRDHKPQVEQKYECS